MHDCARDEWRQNKACTAHSLKRQETIRQDKGRKTTQQHPGQDQRQRRQYGVRSVAGPKPLSEDPPTLFNQEFAYQLETDLKEQRKQQLNQKLDSGIPPVLFTRRRTM